MTKSDYIYYRRLRDELRRAILALSANPAASTTISTGDGQKSVTYKSLNSLQAQLSVAEAKCEAYERAHSGSTGFTVEPVRWS